MKLHTRISLNAGGCILGALCLLMLPLRWNVGFLLAAAVHELSHMMAIRIMGIPITYFEIAPQGAVIGTGAMTQWEEVISAAAGPLGSLSLLLFVHTFPELALSGAVQGFFNLLPVYPLDGGRMLRIFLTGFLGRAGHIAEKVVRTVSLAVILVSGFLMGTFFPRWRICILGGILLILFRGFRKIPCKDVPADVQ